MNWGGLLKKERMQQARMIALEYGADGGWSPGTREGERRTIFNPFEGDVVSERLQLRREMTNKRLTSLKRVWENGRQRRNAALRVWNCTSQRPVVWKNTFAAAAAGTVLTMTTFPLSTIKTQMQAGLHNSFFGCVLNCVRTDGVRKLYSGVRIDLMQNLPYSFLYVSTFETLKSVGLPRPFAAAAGSAASCIVTVPADMVTQRMQVGLHRNELQAVGAILKARGVRGLYAGLLPAFLRILPNAAIQWTVFENLKDVLERRRGGRRLTTCESLVLGGISGCASAVFTCPIDVVKTRLQTNINYRGVGHALEQIVAHEGIGVVFAGLVPRTLLVLPTTAIFFCVYERMKQILYSRAGQLGMTPLKKTGATPNLDVLRRRVGKLKSKLGERLLHSKMLPALSLPVLSLGSQSEDMRASESAVAEAACLQVGLCRQQGSPSSFS